MEYWLSVIITSFVLLGRDWKSLNQMRASAIPESSAVLLVWALAPRKKGEERWVTTLPNCSIMGFPGLSNCREGCVSRSTMTADHPAEEYLSFLEPSVYAKRRLLGVWLGVWTVGVERVAGEGVDVEGGVARG